MEGVVPPWLSALGSRKPCCSGVSQEGEGSVPAGRSQWALKDEDSCVQRLGPCPSLPGSAGERGPVGAHGVRFTSPLSTLGELGSICALCLE